MVRRTRQGCTVELSSFTVRVMFLDEMMMCYYDTIDHFN